MIAAKTILKYLPAYNGDQKLLIENQSVDDIIGAMRKFHKQYGPDYDKIYKFFLGNTPERTAQKIFQFIKDNCSYYVEGIESQTVRNPSAIMATGKLDGIDCKNMSLFIGGLLSAINRSGDQNIPYAYRFAQTDQYDKNYNHVFIVINPKTQREIFVDPIPEVKHFDDRFSIYSYTDKNFESMSLYGISGGFFKIGENKLRDQMFVFIKEAPEAFLYLWLPVGNSGINNWGGEYGWNQSQAIANIPDIVQQKRNLAQQTYWDWGMPTGLKAETEILSAIKAGITSKLGMSPEEYWTQLLGVNIPTRGGVIGSRAKVGFAVAAVVPVARAVIAKLGPLLNNLVPNLTWTHRPETFAPVAEDWASSPYALNFSDISSGGSAVVPSSGGMDWGNLFSSAASVISPAPSRYNPTQNQEVAPVQKSSMNMLVTFGLVGAAIYFLTKKKRA